MADDDRMLTLPKLRRRKPVALRKLPEAQWIDAPIAVHQGDYRPMAGTIIGCIEPEPQRYDPEPE